ncbi:histidine kinase/DNA gyrase B/HSP90-like ATPase [Sphingobacterium allocomposti]|uniref:histidine kinase n=2 Tax=Sphingobacterium allocomposti TaxID=415956 RepID=A0A5S5DBG2_9SPHI|nr:histidine kinase/DNA gyrase B/HSP90-like ATPase [Sphingobacterium composti Yoo et al. 2007 non Ten et al. 2007]
MLMSLSPLLPDESAGNHGNGLRFFYEAFHDGPFGYLFMDEEARTFQHNDKVRELLCVEDAPLNGRVIFDFLLEEERDRVKEFLDSGKETFGEPLRLVKVKCKKQIFRLVTIYLKRIFHAERQENVYVLLFLKNDFNPTSASKEENEVYYKTIIETQEAEREFIGVTLHESIAQELYAIRISLQRFLLEHGHEEEIMPIKKMLNDTIYNVRNISNDLVPTVLRDMGFFQAMDDMIFRLRRAGISFKTSIDRRITEVCRELQFCSYRVIQELFNNCLKHARAKEISLRLRITGKELTIIVEDDGQGFGRDMEDSLRLGTGLRNIRNRIALYAGTMDLSSSPKGSRIQIKLYTN